MFVVLKVIKVIFPKMVENFVSAHVYLILTKIATITFSLRSRNHLEPFFALDIWVPFYMLFSLVCRNLLTALFTLDIFPNTWFLFTGLLSNSLALAHFLVFFCILLLLYLILIRTQNGFLFQHFLVLL